MSESTPIESTVLQIVADRAGVPLAKVRADARLIDFGLDSVQAMDLIMDLEEAFSMRIPDHHVVELETIQDIVGYVRERKEAS